MNQGLSLSNFKESLFKAVDSDKLSSTDHWIIFFVKAVNFTLASYAFLQLVITYVTGTTADKPSIVTLTLAVFGLIVSGIFDMIHRMSRAQLDVYTRIKLSLFGVYGLSYGIPMVLLVSTYIWISELDLMELCVIIDYTIWMFALVLYSIALDTYIENRASLLVKSLLRNDVRPFSDVISDLLIHRIFRYRNFAAIVSIAIAYILLFIEQYFPFGIIIALTIPTIAYYVIVRDRDTIRFKTYSLDKKIDIITSILSNVTCFSNFNIEYNVHYKQRVFEGYGAVFSTTIYLAGQPSIHVIHLSDWNIDPSRIQDELSEDWNDNYTVQLHGPYRCPFTSASNRILVDLTVFRYERLLWWPPGNVTISFQSEELKKSNFIHGFFCVDIYGDFEKINDKGPA